MPAAAVAAAVPAARPARVLTGRCSTPCGPLWLTGTDGRGQRLDGLPGFDELARAVATAIAGNPTAALLPVQATLLHGHVGQHARAYVHELGQLVGSGGAAGSTLASMGDSLLENVGKFIDGKLVAVMGGVGNQLPSWGSRIPASLAAAQHLGGLSVPNAWHGMAPGDGPRRPDHARHQRRRPDHARRPAQQPVRPRA